MKHIINTPASIERLRDFCGLDQGNMMRIASEVRNLIKNETPGKVAASAATRHAVKVSCKTKRNSMAISISFLSFSPISESTEQHIQPPVKCKRSGGGR